MLQVHERVTWIGLYTQSSLFIYSAYRQTKARNEMIETSFKPAGSTAPMPAVPLINSNASPIPISNTVRAVFILLKGVKNRAGRLEREGKRAS